MRGKIQPKACWNSCADASQSVEAINHSTDGGAGGAVPATLALTLGTPAAFRAFTPGVAKDYTASQTANVISTAGDGTLSVADPSATQTGHLVNGAFSLPSPLQVKASSAAGVGSAALKDVGGSSAPTAVLTYSGPTSQRHRDGRVPAAHQCRRRPAHGLVQQDAHVHAVDNYAVGDRTALHSV